MGLKGEAFVMEYEHEEGTKYETNLSVSKDEYQYEYIIVGLGWILIIIGILAIILGILTLINLDRIIDLLTVYVLIIIGFIFFQIGRILKRSKYKEIDDVKYTMKSIINRK